MNQGFINELTHRVVKGLIQLFTEFRNEGKTLDDVIAWLARVEKHLESGDKDPVTDEEGSKFGS